ILTCASCLKHVESHLENKREFRTKTINIKSDITCRQCSEEISSAIKFDQIDNLKEGKCPFCEKVLISVRRLEQQLRSHIPREAKMLP
uniref:Uncharacterized protein n=1 Tax=Glossina palpalis gambiensis TaxID=67801 RepID=A0A1B0B9X8_9MUSC